MVNELSGTVTELDRAYALMNTNYQRRIAAEQQLVAINRKYEAVQRDWTSSSMPSAAGPTLSRLITDRSSITTVRLPRFT